MPHHRRRSDDRRRRREGNVEQAVSIFRTLVEKNEADAAAWLGLGRALHELQRYEEAIVANEKAARGDSERGTAFYNIACEYALLGKKEKAIEAAEKAVAAGLRAKWSFESDPELATIRDDARFKALVSKL